MAAAPWLFGVTIDHRVARIGVLSCLLAAGVCGGVIAACSSSSSHATSAVDGGAHADSGVDLPVATDPSWLNVTGARQPPLPREAATTGQYFTTGDACAQCHLKYQGPDGDACVDAKGSDVSPTMLGRASMEAMSVRDPFYLATFAREREGRSDKANATVEAACATCHAPSATVEAPLVGGKVSFATILSGTQPLDSLARDGISCSLCHQIPADGLGTEASFGGKITIGSERAIFGPHQNPETSPMKFFVNYIPTYSGHMMQSELCATCHVVRTPLIDDSGAPTGTWFLEQGTYFEWQNSDYAQKGTTCQTCHMPRVDDDNMTIQTRLAHPPAASGVTVKPRVPFGKHTAPGGNSYMLHVMGENTTWVGTGATQAQLEDQAKKTDAQLAKAVTLDIKSATRANGIATVLVHLVNGAGHKFPTGYPSRRAWLHVTVHGPDGAVVFESGRPDAFGRIVTRDNRLVDRPSVFEPHHDVIDDDTHVQIYEAVSQDEKGTLVTRLLDAASYAKDNRLTPVGFSSSYPGAGPVLPFGTDGDPNFGSEDTVTYDVAVPDGAITVDVELLYESVSPRAFDALMAAPTDTSRAFFDMAKKRPPTPVKIASATKSL